MIKKRKGVKYLAKNTAIFALSSLSTKFIVFLLVPLYTWKLSTSEYGVTDLLFTITGFLYPLLSLNIIEAVFRFSIDRDKDEAKIIHNAILCNLLCIFLGLFSIPIIKNFTSFPDLAFFFYFYLISVSVSQTLLALLRGQEKLKLFAIGNILNTVCVAVFSIIFLVFFNLSVDGYFLAYIVSNILTIIFCLIFGRIRVVFKRKHFDKKYLRSMLKYSVVLLPTTFMWWIINSSDRVMVTSMISPSANGIYAISYKIPTILTVAISIFNQAWFYSAVRAEKKTDREQKTNLAYKHLLRFATLAIVAILIFLKPFTKIYVDDNFYMSWQYVPILLVGFCFQALATFIATTYSVEKNSKGMLFSGLSGAVMNIILNFLLIPIIGVYGAAIATLISYITVFLYRYLDTKKTVKVNILSPSNIKMYVLILLCAVSAYLDGALSYIAMIIILGIYLYFTRDTLKEVAVFLRKRKNKNARR